MVVGELQDGRGSKSRAKVTAQGQLVTSPIEYSQAYNATAGTANVAANFIGPKTGKRFVITGVLLSANQGVSNTTDATVVIYEADAPDTATVSKTILSTNMVRQDRINLGSVNLIVTEGKWVNLKTTDDDVFGTIFGYYIEA